MTFASHHRNLESNLYQLQNQSFLVTKFIIPSFLQTSDRIAPTPDRILFIIHNSANKQRNEPITINVKYKETEAETNVRLALTRPRHGTHYC